MADKEPYKWITVKGKHIPVYKNEYGEDVFGAGREDYKSSEDMAKRIVGENDTYFSDSFKTSRNRRQEIERQEEQINQQIENLRSQLEREYIEDEEAVKMLGKNYAGMFGKYTDKGEKILQNVNSLKDEYNKLHEEKNRLQTLENLETRSLYNRQKMEWLQRIENTSTMQLATKQNYAGFKLNESTTPIDSDLRTGRAEVFEMSPKEYIERANYQIFQQQLPLAQNIHGRFYKQVNQYAEQMRQGVKFDTPYLDYENEGQEGIHRAMAAILNGYEKIPVIVKKRRG